MEWLKIYNEVICDPKWPLIARKADVPRGCVVSVWIALLVCANNDASRGSVEKFDCEVMDANYGYEDGTCQRVLDALMEKGLIVEGRLASWEARQGVKGAKTGGDRVREFRERKKAETVSAHVTLRENEVTDVTPCNDEVTRCNECNVTVTPCNDEVTDVTLKTREEKNRIKENITDFSQSGSAGKSGEGASPGGAARLSSVISGRKDKKPPDEPHYKTRRGRYLTGERLESFNRFWKDFALLKGKADAADAWLDIGNLTDSLVEVICRAAREEAANREGIEKRGGTPKWAQGWIISRRWEDYEIPARTGPSSVAVAGLPQPGEACGLRDPELPDLVIRALRGDREAKMKLENRRKQSCARAV